MIAVLMPSPEQQHQEQVTNGTVLLVEDDEAVRFGMASALRARRFVVQEAASCDEALQKFAEHPDLVITDLRLPDGDAVDLLRRLRPIQPMVPVPVYVVTGFATVDVAVRAVKEGAEEFFTKPVELNKLLRCVETVMSRRNVSKITPSQRLFTSFVPRSPAMQQLEMELRRLRESDCTVLILGETGTGKTKLARRIHELGARREGPFVDINCAGLSRDFVESELFGHERGAFTGAHATKPGLLEAATGGTVFLDEIGDIDLQVQPKILKVLEERRYRRMGDIRERTADVRLIAATHLELLDAVEERAFRADLFYRISTVTLRLPALRERNSDIAPLAREVLVNAGHPDVTVTSDACDKLRSYGWPGNIRELKNVVQRALLRRNGNILTADDIRFDGETRSSAKMLAVQLAPENASTLEEMERKHIRQALAEENGRVKDAAVRLGISRSTLYQKLKTYGIPLPSRDQDSSGPPDPDRHE